MTNYFGVFVRLAVAVGMMSLLTVGTGWAAGKPLIYEKTAGEIFAEIDAECAGKVPCEAQGLFARAKDVLHADNFAIYVDLMEAQVSPRHTSKAKREAATRIVLTNARTTALPLIDRSLALALPSATKDAIGRYRAQFQRCVDEIPAAARETEDSYMARADACNAAATRMADQILVLLGDNPLVKHIGFRDFQWGASETDIEAKEGSPSVRTLTKLTYASKMLNGSPVIILFEFVDGHLAKGFYMFTDEHSEPNAYIRDFNSVTELLTTKYGARNPGETVVWNNPLFKSDHAKWGLAIGAGQMKMEDGWIGSDTDTVITHKLVGDNFKLRHLLFYDSVEYAPALDAARTKTAAKGL